MFPVYKMKIIQSIASEISLRLWVSNKNGWPQFFHFFLSWEAKITSATAMIKWREERDKWPGSETLKGQNSITFFFCIPNWSSSAEFVTCQIFSGAKGHKVTLSLVWFIFPLHSPPCFEKLKLLTCTLAPVPLTRWTPRLMSPVFSFQMMN